MCIGLVYIYIYTKREMRCQIFPMIKRSYCSSQRFRRRYKIYIICLNTISIQRRAIDTKYPVPSCFQETAALIFPPKKWSRFLVFNNHTRVAVFIKAAPKRLLSGLEAGSRPATRPENPLFRHLSAPVYHQLHRGSRVNALHKKFSLQSCGCFLSKIPLFVFFARLSLVSRVRAEIVSAFRQDDDGRGVALVRDLFSRLVFETNMQIQI